MTETLHNHDVADLAKSRSKIDWRKAMSDHVANALLVYTGLQIVMTVNALSEGSSSIMPYAALVILVVAIIPGCRWFERRWTALRDEEAFNPGLARTFRRDTVVLWAMAIGLPFVLTGLVMGRNYLFAG